MKIARNMFGAILLFSIALTGCQNNLSDNQDSRIETSESQVETVSVKRGRLTPTLQLILLFLLLYRLLLRLQ